MKPVFVALICASSPVIAFAAQGGLPVCQARNELLEGQVAQCRENLQSCVDSLVACKWAPISALTGGAAQSLNAEAFVSVPPGALLKDQSIAVAQVLRPVVDAERLSNVYEFAPSQTFAKPVTVCLKSAAAVDGEACLGYLDSAQNPPEWKCEDKCLTQESGYLCGKTDHFTNFAILLSGAGGSDKCSGDSNYITGKTGGVATSPDGAAFVSLAPGALSKDGVVTVARVEKPVVDTKRASDIYDFGPSQKLAGDATVCLPSSVGTKDTCLGFLDTAANPPTWKCQDSCLKQVSNTVCGKTDHFTNFAILLSGAGSTDKCSAER